MIKPFPVILIFFISCIASTAMPQSAGINTFNSISIRINAVSNRSTDDLNRYWTGDKGFEGAVQTPFYFGDIQVGIRYIPYKEKEPYYHDFSTFFYFLGWGEELKLPLNCSFYTGIKFGGFGMAFHDDSLTIYQKDETEFAAGINSYFAFMVFKNFQLVFGADYTKVYTHKKIELFLLSGGLSYAFQTPRWLKDILN